MSLRSSASISRRTSSSGKIAGRRRWVSRRAQRARRARRRRHRFTPAKKRLDREQAALDGGAAQRFHRFGKIAADMVGGDRADGRLPRRSRRARPRARAGNGESRTGLGDSSIPYCRPRARLCPTPPRMPLFPLASTRVQSERLCYQAGATRKSMWSARGYAAHYFHELLELRASGRDDRARWISRALSAMRSAAARMPQLLVLRPRLQQSVPRNDGGASGGQGTIEFLRILHAQCRSAAAPSLPASRPSPRARRSRAARRAVQEEKTMRKAPGAIVLAAGLGTRMRSARAKVLHELGGEPMIARVMRSLAPLAPAPLVLVAGHQGDEVAAAAARAFAPGVRVEVARQPAQRGTGDAARCGLERFRAGLRRRRADPLRRHADDPAGDAARRSSRSTAARAPTYRSSARCWTTRARMVAWFATARAR